MTGEIRAVCRKPVIDVMEAFRLEFTGKGKARLRLAVTIEQDEVDAATFEGTFVAMT